MAGPCQEVQGQVSRTARRLPTVPPVATHNRRHRATLFTHPSVYFSRTTLGHLSAPPSFPGRPIVAHRYPLVRIWHLPLAGPSESSRACVVVLVPLAPHNERLSRTTSHPPFMLGLNSHPDPARIGTVIARLRPSCCAIPRQPRTFQSYRRKPKQCMRARVSPPQHLRAVGVIIAQRSLEIICPLVDAIGNRRWQQFERKPVRKSIQNERAECACPSCLSAIQSRGHGADMLHSIYVATK